MGYSLEILLAIHSGQLPTDVPETFFQDEADASLKQSVSKKEQAQPAVVRGEPPDRRGLQRRPGSM